MRLHKTCEWCGLAFVARERRQRTCGRDCYMSALYRRNRDREDRSAALSLAADANARGWAAHTVYTTVQGWCVEAMVPGITEPLIFSDDEDVRFLLCDLGRLRQEAA